MIRELFRFEVAYHLRSPLFWLAGLLFFLLSFGAVTTDSIVIGGAIGNVNRNAPFVIMQLLLVMSAVGAFATTAFVASAVVRDFDHGTDGLFFTTPVGKLQFLGGRFAGAYTVSVLIFVFVVAGIMLGTAMPWIEAERLGPFSLAPYGYAMGVLIVPNLFITSAIFFSAAVLTRSMWGTYVTLVVFLVAYVVAVAMAQNLEMETLASLVDPWGTAPFAIATQYWTVAQRNAELLPLEGLFLRNRLVWIGVGVASLLLALWRFSFTTRPARKRKKRREEDRVEEERRDLADQTVAPVGTLLARAAERDFSFRAGIRQLAHRSLFEAMTVVKSAPFIIILAMGVLNLVGGAVVTDRMFGTPVYPRTHLMFGVIASSFLLFAIIILTFYSGELIWKERSRGMDEVHDALPVPNWVLWGSKMAALSVVLVAILAVAVLASMGYQLSQGFTDLQPLLYLKGVGLQVGYAFVLLGILAVFFQVATNHKYAGFGLMVLYFLSLPVLPALDLQHNLYRFAGTPPAPYSDMNGFGHFVEPVLWFDAYWGFFTLGLLVLVHLFWVRGRDSGLGTRLRLARQRVSGPVLGVAGVAALGFLGSGGWIYYNTNVLNQFLPTDQVQDRQAEYEKRYQKYEGIPQPKITSVYAEVDIFPYRRAVDVRGTYLVRNKEEFSLDSLHMVWSPGTIDTLELDVPGATVAHDDPELGYRIYAFDVPMAPGDEMELGYRVAVRTRGFVNHGSNTDLVYNGTFFNNAQYFPHIGYDDNFELGDPNERRRRDLPPVERMPSLFDSAHYDTNYLTGESDWVDFETVVSTSPDQIALAPGYLEREWEEDGRRYFHYRMDAPILGFWSYLSAKWAVRRDRWNDVDIAVYYHPDHDYNVDRMIEATKKSLDYYTREFGPYQHRQVRILEFPRYATFAQSFPNTIPFSESIGFIARLEDPDDIDYVFYVTAHEVAHQWWAHQVMGANVQGATVTSETMAQYSALMVQEEEYGPLRMRRFLRYELDAYLQGRGGELIEELPLYRVENQGYIHYRKGSLVTYALRDYIGEAAFNRAMRRYVGDVRFSGPPYTTSAEYLDYLTAEVPPEHMGAVEDLFRTITLWELEAEEARWEETEDGRYRVRLTVDATKYRSDGQGTESPVEMDDLVDVAVFGAEEEGAPPEGRVLYLEKRRMGSGASVLEIVVDEAPARAGIDPFNKLIDRNPENNVVNVGRMER